MYSCFSKGIIVGWFGTFVGVVDWSGRGEESGETRLVNVGGRDVAVALTVVDIGSVEGDVLLGLVVAPVMRSRRFWMAWSSSFGVPGCPSMARIRCWVALVMRSVCVMVGMGKL